MFLMLSFFFNNNILTYQFWIFIILFVYVMKCFNERFNKIFLTFEHYFNFIFVIFLFNLKNISIWQWIEKHEYLRNKNIMIQIFLCKFFFDEMRIVQQWFETCEIMIESTYLNNFSISSKTNQFFIDCQHSIFFFNFLT